ncbi:unnamed protein product [Pleuronectes platessa]|uniref:Uncharacterized protein n=1 Tax=Pleuronectes platessa TaxID=8262 RepID=A0A9N7W2Y2_PLEPL|nr:unnamed protein product [Pleuronectes platessa]
MAVIHPDSHGLSDRFRTRGNPKAGSQQSRERWRREELTEEEKESGTKDRGILDPAGPSPDPSCPPVEAWRDHKWCLNRELHGCASGSKDHPERLLSFNYLEVFRRTGPRATEPFIQL